MSRPDLTELLESGEVARAEPDPSAAAEELEVARRHIASAATVRESDPIAAFAVGYEAVRKAISAHMRANGYRTRRGPGQHTRVGRYALAALETPATAAHLEAFDALRLLRNQSQYEGLEIVPEEVDELLVHARAIVGAIGDDLGL